MKLLIVLVTCLVMAPSLAAVDLKVLQLPIRSDGPKSIDPVKGSTVYDNEAVCQVYETLLQYKYLARPPALEPLLLSGMPELAADGLTYRFQLKKGGRFHDDPCFPGGQGRELAPADVFYSWKRMADNGNLPKSWWLFEDTIAGFDEYRDAQNQAAAGGGKFDYGAPVKGFRALNDREFEVELKRPVQRFLWILAMFQTAIVPREAVEKYGPRFGRHPVGTGPFTLKEEDWVPGKSLVVNRNPHYHECFYPKEHMPEDEEFGFHLPAGARLPIADRIEYTFFVQDQPMWLQFQAGKLGYIQVPAEYFSQAFNKRTRKLLPALKKEGIAGHAVPLLDFIFRGFNMEDPLLGGYTPEKKSLRQAICLALDWEEQNDSFYNGINIIYDGPVPPGLEGHPRDGKGPVSYRGPDLERARQFLAKAGYPEGKGLPVIDYYSSLEANGKEQAEMLTRQLVKIGVRINARLSDFSTLIEAITKKKALFFSFAWSSDYPDGENNLALFYGPNESPGSNHFNYKNPEYDLLYKKIQTMPPSEERTRLYEKMRDMVIEDAPFAGSMARTRFYLVNPWLKNFKPTEDFSNWSKYLDVDDSKRKR
ncbi:MAG: hypothetical protein HY717_04130 [Planctomycetes bacterium]|nr:hypothetical protein [Planctomycetota bacterium]